MKNNLVSHLMIFNFILLNTFFAAASGHAPAQKAGPQSISIRLRLHTAATVKVNKAPLKYDKHLAYSFMVDDGYRSAYLTAFPLLNGGQVSPPFPDEWHNDEGGDGEYSKGLFFSDGCNNAVSFKMGIAINAAAINDKPANRGHLSWPEVKMLSNAGWDILNHGYHHATKHGTDFDAEVRKNEEAVKDQLGFYMTQFVVPGGESDPGYEHQYEKAALSSKALAVASINGAGPVISADQPVNLSSLIYRRNFIRSAADTLSASVVEACLKTVDSLMRQPQPIWYNEFSHGLGNSNLWSLSLRYPEFKYYMTTLADRYGLNGSDKLWMAPWQEVYEYIWLRDRIKISTQQKGRDVVIKLTLPEIPGSFRYLATTLTIQTAAAFSLISSDPACKVTYNGKGNHKLINLQLLKK